MNPKTALILSAVGGLAGYLAYHAYELTQIESGLIVLFILSWFFFSMIGWENLWNLLAFFKNPFMAALMIAGLGFTYWTYQGNPLPDASTFGFGMLFIGAAFSMLIYMYWNIGG
ncbi:MAG: hypothetical protein BRC30_01485 [Nanohaloarchaea archaeon SW_7_46_7]|nr:MAG: hypothetical protein BRC30_01485 [Nanohaloarchaea archaeon SW_7_46_7]